MMKPMKRLIPLVLVLTLAFGLTGCVYLRLLEVKNQLAGFDKHFHVSISDNHFILNLLHPVLLSEDWIYLTKLRPSRIGSTPEGYQWFIDFVIDGTSSKGRARKTIVFAMTFNNEGKLTDFDFSPLFLEMAPPAFLEASMRSLGRGKVDQDKRQLRVDPEDLPKFAVRPPSRKKILEVLGPPHEQFPKGGLKVFKYRFKAATSPVEPGYEDRRFAETKLYFDPKDELARLSGRFAGLKLAIDYRKFAQPLDGGQEKTASRD